MACGFRPVKCLAVLNISLLLTLAPVLPLRFPARGRNHSPLRITFSLQYTSWNTAGVIVAFRTRLNLYFVFFQVIVWGDYGRMDHKCFMGVAQILLEELDLSSVVIGWYKLFPPSSLVDPTLTPLTRRASQSSLESSTGPPCIRS